MNESRCPVPDCIFTSEDAEEFNAHMRAHDALTAELRAEQAQAEEKTHEQASAPELVKEALEYHASVAGILSRLDDAENAIRSLGSSMGRLEAGIASLVDIVAVLQKGVSVAAPVETPTE
jgi:hypothetical protein